MMEEQYDIFISYRREESAGHAGRIADGLGAHFGKDRVFQDIDSIEPSLDFAEAIKNAVDSSKVLIAVIGKNWLTATDAAGQKRLENPNDYVQIEITTALKHNIRVIPLLIQRASMPSADELADELAPLAGRQAFELHDSSWREDIQRLITTLDKVLGEEHRAQETALQAYLEQLTQWVREGLHAAEPHSPVRVSARGRTLQMFRQLDPKGKRALLKKLHEAGLIGKGTIIRDEAGTHQPVIALSGVDLREAYLWELHLNRANLSGADLSKANLSDADLSYANLWSADLTEADLSGANLSDTVLRDANLSDTVLRDANLRAAYLGGANLSKADLSGANLSYANLSDAGLSKANLSDADLSKANLSDADLSEARVWTLDQLSAARTLEGATMPNGQKYENWLLSKGRGKDG
jgi:uncharacterized protein YjbI with pentapeptide repeats